MTMLRLPTEPRPIRVLDLHPLFTGNDDLPVLIPPAGGQRVRAVLVRILRWLWY